MHQLKAANGLLGLGGTGGTGTNKLVLKAGHPWSSVEVVVADEKVSRRW
jgi:hypothetical protein